MSNDIDQEMLSLKIEKVEAAGHIDAQDFMKIIPEVVQDLRTFDGKPTKLVGWMDDVDIIIESLSQCENTPENKDILSAIRFKIVGSANEFLIGKNTVLSWKCIKEDLIMHFMEKNDLMILNTKLNRLRKKQQSIEEFYEKFVNIQKVIKSCLRLELSQVILSIPSTQVSVERSFSALALIVSHLRTQMTSETINDINL